MRKLTISLSMLATVAALAPACGDKEPKDSGWTEGDTDSDTDADTDTDTDANTEIYKARTGEYTAGDGSGDPLGDEVTIEGVVVGSEALYGFFVQDGYSGPYHGVYVYTGSSLTAGVAEGDWVEVTGTVEEYMGSGSTDTLTEIWIADAAGLTVSGTSEVPAAEVLATSELADGATAEGYESMLVKVENVTVVEADLGYGEWSVGDGVRIDDLFEPETPWDVLYAGDQLTGVSGVLYYSFDSFKIEPRTTDDYEGHSSTGPICNADTCAEDLAPGDLVVTEAMMDPQTGSDDYCEWIEVYNARSGSVDLARVLVVDSAANTGTVADETIVGAGEYAVIARTTEADFAANCATLAAVFTPDGYYGSNPALNNGGDTIALTTPDSSVTIDSTADYGSQDCAQVTGTSAGDNDDTADWCACDTELATDGSDTDYGTPGAANSACP